MDGKSFKVFRVKDPAELDWASVGATIVVESTGLFTKGADARKHIRGPVKKVIISAPATDPDHTLVLGVNDKTYDPGEASRDFERFLHHELPGARRESAARHLRHQRRHDDHDSLLHERSETARPAAQGSCAARAPPRFR